MRISRKLVIVIYSIIITLSFSAMRTNAQTEVGRITTCKHEVAGRYCTACGKEMIILSPGITVYALMFSDILEKYNLKIEQKNRAWTGASLQKITGRTILEFKQLLNLTRKYCDEEGYNFEEMISRGALYTGKGHLGFPVTKHFTEILY